MTEGSFVRLGRSKTLNIALALSNLASFLSSSGKEHGLLMKLRLSLQEVSQEPVKIPSLVAIAKHVFGTTIDQDLPTCSVPQKFLSSNDKEVPLHTLSTTANEGTVLCLIDYHFPLRTQKILYPSWTTMDDDFRWRQSWTQKTWVCFPGTPLARTIKCSL